MSGPRPAAFLHRGVLVVEGGPAELSVASEEALAVTPLPLAGRHLLDPVPTAPLTVSVPGAAPVTLRPGGWAGAVTEAAGGRIAGWARDETAPARDVVVAALGPHGTAARATARAADGHRFEMVLPGATAHAPHPTRLTLGIAGSDFVLAGGHVTAGGARRTTRPPRPDHPALRIKVCTPDLRMAPAWGDSHFAAALADAFARLGRPAGVDCLDAWHGRGRDEDAVLVVRGRQPVELDPGKINVMWLISHPDRVPEAEYALYDRVFVASDLYAAHLRARGLAEAEVLHQATDATLFAGPAPPGPRDPTPLFLGNSRREWRTMVRWCLAQGIELDLHGGGWEGLLPPGVLRGASVANADLPALYGGRLLLLNDHWASMRDNGFLSNRLFDGAAAGTPVLTDPVAGLEAVFGDTVATAASAEALAAQVRACQAEPEAWLARAARAREIVLGAHTFDHRAATLAAALDAAAARRGRA